MSNVGKVKNVLKGIVDGIPLKDLESKSIYELQAMLRVIRKSAKLAEKECKRIEWNERNGVKIEQVEESAYDSIIIPISGEEIDALEKISIELQPWFSTKKGFPTKFEASILSKSEHAIRTKEYGWIPLSTIVSEPKVS